MDGARGATRDGSSVSDAAHTHLSRGSKLRSTKHQRSSAAGCCNGRADTV